jgi:tetratricopeptide (TPR) repeat protein
LTYSRRARAWNGKHDRQKALADYSTAIQLEPGNPFLFLVRGDAWSREGDHARAIADYNEAIRLAPNDADAFTTRAIEWQKNLEPDHALADFQKAISLNPKQTIAYVVRGMILKDRKEYDKVAANFVELVRANPADPTGHKELASLLATSVQPDVRDGKRAVEEATIACKLTNWADPDCLDTLAAACAEAGDFDAAVKWQARAIELLLARNRGVGDVRNPRKEMSMRDRLSLYNTRMPYHEKPGP